MNRILVAAVVLALSACSAAPVKVLNCNRDPQYWSTDAKGQVNQEIRVCFGENHALLWDARPVAPPMAAAAPAPAAQPATKPAVKKPAKPAPAVKLPTLGGAVK